jgi:hypothetical protein
MSAGKTAKLDLWFENPFEIDIDSAASIGDKLSDFPKDDLEFRVMLNTHSCNFCE